jgi:hypothetical protein
LFPSVIDAESAKDSACVSSSERVLSWRSRRYATLGVADSAVTIHTSTALTTSNQSQTGMSIGRTQARSNRHAYCAAGTVRPLQLRLIMKKAAKRTAEIGRRRKATANDRRLSPDEVRRDDTQPDSPRGSFVARDPTLIGAQRFPRKGDDDVTP